MGGDSTGSCLFQKERPPQGRELCDAPPLLPIPGPRGRLFSTLADYIHEDLMCVVGCVLFFACMFSSGEKEGEGGGVPERQRLSQGEEGEEEEGENSSSMWGHAQVKEK